MEEIGKHRFCTPDRSTNRLVVKSPHPRPTSANFQKSGKSQNRSAHHKNGSWRFSENNDLKKFQTYQTDYRNFFQQRRRAVSSCRRYFRKVRLIPYRIVLLFFLSFRYPHIFSWWRHIPTPSMHFLLDKHNYDLSH